MPLQPLALHHTEMGVVPISSDPGQPEAAMRRQMAKCHRQQSTLALVVRTQDTSQVVVAQ